MRCLIRRDDPQSRLRLPRASPRASAVPRRRETISSLHSLIYEVADRAYCALLWSIRCPVRAWLSIHDSPRTRVATHESACVGNTLYL